MPMIIIEGIDGSGKSTLAEKIAEASPLPVRIEHRGVPEQSLEDEYLAPLLKVRDDELVIADRWHVGEMIYGPLYRGSSELIARPDLRQLIESQLDEIGAVRIVLAPSLRTVKDRLKKRGEDYLQENHVSHVYAEYLEWAMKLRYKVLGVPTKRDVQDLIEKAIR